MRVFETESMYDKESSEWVETYLIDGHEVEAEEYFEEMENESSEDEESLQDLITDDYVEELQGVMCPHCIKEILTRYFIDMVESFSDEE
jgi:hypothetical protein